MKGKILFIPVLFLLILGTTCIAFGQATNSGNISGTVTDTTGAVVPGVTVTILNTDTNVTHTFTTNNSGVYDTGSLVPDHYLLTFTKAGFATYKRGPIELSVGQIGINAQLTVGQTTQKVVVTAGAPLLQTTNPQMSTTFSQKTLQSLPQTSSPPDWRNFVIQQPGTTGTPQTGANATNAGMQVATDGSLPFSTVLLDGSSMSSPMSDNMIRAPIYEAIAEVKVSDSLFSAKYGTGGVIYNQISKSGTDKYHGELYEYFQNNALDAAPYQFGGSNKVPSLHYNDFGFNIGGPIPVPRFRHRAFFFFDWDKTVNHGGANNSGFITVPTEAMREGNFTGASTIYDPTTQTIDSNGIVHRESFAQEYGNGNRIPASMIDPVAAAIQAYFPKPNVPGVIVGGIPTNNYFYNLPNSVPERKFFGRLDVDVSPKNHITGSSAWNNYFDPNINPACPMNCFNADIFNTGNQLSDVWTLSNTFVNEARFGFMGEYDIITPQTLDQGYPAKIGLQFSKADIFPTIQIDGEYTLGNSTNSEYRENSFDISDTATLIEGKHVLQFGGEMLIYRADSTPWGNIHGADLSFAGDYTAATQGATTSTATSYADFLLGYASHWDASVHPEYGAREKMPQLFAQDTYKVTPKLTLDIGLRWMGTTGWSTVKGNELSFDPTVMNPATGTYGAMWYAATHANGRTSLQHPVWNEFMPRFGFALALGDKTTVRGGYGIYSYPWNTDNYGSGLGGAFGSSGNESDSTNGADPVVLLSSAGNTNYQGSSGAAINSLYKTAPLAPDAYNGQSVNYNDIIKACQPFRAGTFRCSASWSKTSCFRSPTLARMGAI